MSKVVDADSKEGQKFLKGQDEPTKRPASSSGGLSNLVNAINKKPKMGCLDKSKMDWDQYVANQGIKEELETFNKGKDGWDHVTFIHQIFSYCQWPLYDADTWRNKCSWNERI